MVLCYASIVRTTQKHLKTCRNYSLPETPGSVDQVQTKDSKKDRIKVSDMRGSWGWEKIKFKTREIINTSIFVIVTHVLAVKLQNFLILRLKVAEGGGGGG